MPCLTPTKVFSSLCPHIYSDFILLHFTALLLAAIIVLPKVLYALCLIKINRTSALFTIS